MSIVHLLRTSQVTLRSALFMHVALLLVWSTASIVQGFGRYDAVPPAGFNAISHVGFWLAIEILVVAIGFMSISFDITTVEKGLALTTKRIGKMITFWMVVLVLAMAANIVHIVAAALELKDCQSTLCLLNKGFLIALLVWLAVILFIEVMEFYAAYVYKHRIRVSHSEFLIKKEK